MIAPKSMSPNKSASIAEFRIKAGRQLWILNRRNSSMYRLTAPVTERVVRGSIEQNKNHPERAHKNAGESENKF